MALTNIPFELLGNIGEDGIICDYVFRKIICHLQCNEKLIFFIKVLILT